MSKYSDRILQGLGMPEDGINKEIVDSYVNISSMMLEGIINSTHSAGWALSEMLRVGLTPSNASRRFPKQSEHHYLLARCNKIATELYQMVREDIEGQRNDKD